MKGFGIFLILAIAGMIILAVIILSMLPRVFGRRQTISPEEQGAERERLNLLTPSRRRAIAYITSAVALILAGYAIYTLIYFPPQEKWGQEGIYTLSALVVIGVTSAVWLQGRSRKWVWFAFFASAAFVYWQVWIVPSEDTEVSKTWSRWQERIVPNENTGTQEMWFWRVIAGIVGIMVITNLFSSVRRMDWNRRARIIWDGEKVGPKRSWLAVGVGILSFIFGIAIAVLYFYGELWFGPNWTLAYNLPHFLEIAWEWPVKIEPVPLITTFFSALTFILGGVILIIRDEPQTMRGWLLLAAVMGLLFFAYQNIPHEAFWWLLGYYILIVTPLWAANAKNSVPKSSSA